MVKSLRDRAKPLWYIFLQYKGCKKGTFEDKFILVDELDFFLCELKKKVFVPFDDDKQVVEAVRWNDVLDLIGGKKRE